jgi:hypothetical protein
MKTPRLVMRERDRESTCLFATVLGNRCERSHSIDWPRIGVIIRSRAYDLSRKIRREVTNRYALIWNGTLRDHDIQGLEIWSHSSNSVAKEETKPPKVTALILRSVKQIFVQMITVQNDGRASMTLDLNCCRIRTGRRVDAVNLALDARSTIARGFFTDWDA